MTVEYYIVTIKSSVITVAEIVTLQSICNALVTTADLFLYF